MTFVKLPSGMKINLAQVVWAEWEPVSYGETDEQRFHVAFAAADVACGVQDKLLTGADALALEAYLYDIAITLHAPESEDK